MPTYTGTSYSEVLTGSPGDDIIIGMGGYDTLTGGGGNDIFVFSNTGPGLGNNTIRDFSPGDRIDLSDLGVYAFADLASFISQDGPDALIYFGTSAWIRLKGIAISSLTAADFVFDTRSGPRTMIGTGDAPVFRFSVLFGGPGDDTFIGGNQRDIYTGGGGNDTYIFRRRFSADTITDFGRGDRIDLSALGIPDMSALSLLLEQHGSDLVIRSFYHSSDEILILKGVTAASLTAKNFIFDTSTAPRTLTGTLYRDCLFGGIGDDSLNGGNSNDILVGGRGNDTLNGGWGDDRLIGGAGYDTVVYTGLRGGGVTVDLALSGPQRTGGGGIDTLSGIERIHGSGYRDVLSGNDGFNRLIGIAGNDVLDGRGGHDVLIGGTGNDVLIGGGGRDILTGGAGADTFAFDARPDSAEFDTVTDFVSGTDRLRIDASVFGGGLVAGGGITLVSGANPTPAGHSGGVFLYNAATGALAYDADGDGAGLAQVFVRLSGRPGLAATDFEVIA